ncbi:thiopeptide-type bacteriocin biosynthesis protein [Kitasatospora sp. NPDC004669]|uniref:thiopeptide-type bacteriocin biosynthesis protein n=1 Tax=Kitasatospora sp. NPDC004669 TaxID=3154555 RepID=UPI0033B61424
MPADRLTTLPEQPLAPPTDPARVEAAVWCVLAGTPVTDAAAAAGLDPHQLAAAAETYQQAGRDALRQQTAATCWQAYIQFTNWPAAEAIAAQHLAPALHAAEAAGTTWWIIRKHPCWRLRLHHDPHHSDAPATVTAALDVLTASGAARWWTGLYEPETFAFGGDHAMAIAHRLFHADSRAILHHSAFEPWPLGRRELSVLLCTTMFHAAGLEWYEMGDVWQHVSHERPLPDHVPLDQLPRTVEQIRQLLLADTEPDGPLFHHQGPAAFAAPWADAFRQAGTTLGADARAGALDRGLRRVLAYHVIFHWNRLGIPYTAQGVLARAARDAIFG